MKQRILVTPRSATKSGHPSLGALEEGGFEIVLSRAGVLPTKEDLLHHLPGCVGYLAGVETIPPRSWRMPRSSKPSVAMAPGPMPLT